MVGIPTQKLVLEHISFSYGQFMPFLKDVNLNVCSGEIVVVTGRSGHCKSTLLEICGGLKRPDSGRVFWDSKEIGTLSREELFEARQTTGYMFQQHALISNLPLFENLALPLRYRGGMTEDAIRDRVRQCMDMCGLFNVDRSFPESLSTGELRCAALARSLVIEPSLLILDEPTIGVDLVAEHGIINIIRDLWVQRHVAILVVSNSVHLVRELDCRVCILDTGRLRTLNEILELPVEAVPYSAQFMKDAYEEGRKQRSVAG